MINNYLKYITEEARFLVQETTKRINRLRENRIGFIERNVFRKNIKEIRENEPL